MLENLGMCFKSEFVFFRVLVEDELDFNFVFCFNFVFMLNFLYMFNLTWIYSLILCSYFMVYDFWILILCS